MQQISEFICDGKVEKEFWWKFFLKWFFIKEYYPYETYVENEIFIARNKYKIFTTYIDFFEKKFNVFYFKIKIAKT